LKQKQKRKRKVEKGFSLYNGKLYPESRSSLIVVLLVWLT